MKLQIWHFASSAATLMAKRDSEIRIPFGAGTTAHILAVPPGRQRVACDEIRLVISLA